MLPVPELPEIAERVDAVVPIGEQVRQVRVMFVGTCLHLQRALPGR